MDNKIRFPRPLGITQLMVEYHGNNDISLLDKVKTYIIQQWLISNGTICGKSYSILELSSFIGCDSELIRTHMKEQVLSTKIWDKENQEELVNSMVGQMVVWALEDRMEVNQQVNVLRNSQGNSYRPYISAELNKALDLKLKSSSSLQSIVSKLSGSGSVNIFNQYNQQNNQINQGVNVEEAIQIIQQENSKLIDTTKEVMYIEANYPTEEFPEVVATKQTGIDTSKEGLTISKGEVNSIVDNYTFTKNEFEKEHHNIRREIELGIDMEEEDPELSIYPS